MATWRLSRHSAAETWLRALYHQLREERDQGLCTADPVADVQRSSASNPS